jgi:hypothetical protein
MVEDACNLPGGFLSEFQTEEDDIASLIYEEH